MKNRQLRIAVIKGDGIGVDVANATLAVIAAAERRIGDLSLGYEFLDAGAACFRATGRDMAPAAEEAAAAADAIFLGAIGLPSVRHEDGTEIAPHLRLRETLQLYAGVRPIKAYPNAPRRLAEKRKARGGKGRVTCVDKANVFRSMAFFRQIFDERAARFPGVERSYNYVDAQALDLIRRPWDFDVLVMENMFGDILSDLAGGLVGGMGMAACAEIGDAHGLFQPAHGSAPDIMGQDKANPLAAILSGALMLDYLAERFGLEAHANAARMIETAIQTGFEANRLRPVEFGGDQGTAEVTREVIALVEEPRA